MSGTIGGVGNNAIGVAGVCWSVKLISAKFLGADGGERAARWPPPAAARLPAWLPDCLAT